MRRLRLSDEHGGALVMAALFMVGLVAVVAFAVDTGALYEERRELQNAADAAVLAIAEDCGWGITPCDDSYATATAESYSDANSLDEVSAVGALDLDVGAQTVTVATHTEASGGGTILKPFFAQVIGFDGATVAAEATAIWGHPAGLGTIPLIISQCEWDDPDRPEAVEGPPFDGVQPWTFYFHRGQGPPTSESCTAQAGQDWDLENYIPGGFGWLESDDCWVDTVIGEWVLKDPGSSVSNGCSPSELREALLGPEGNGATVNFPYFDMVRGNGTIEPGGGPPEEESGRGYRILGYGAIHVTGYNFGGQYKESVTGTLPCNGSDRCMEGYITFGTDSGGPVGGPNLGILIVKLTG